MHATARRAVSVAVAALVVVAELTGVAGCSIGDVRRRSQATPPIVAPGRPTPVTPDDVRRVPVPVPGDYTQQQVEFTDAGHGYALFTRCGAGSAAGATPTPSCPAILLSTTDGGERWHQVTLPRPVAGNHQLYARGTHLLLLAEPYGWYSSTDRGRSFAHIPLADGPPAAYFALFGRFQACCDADPVRRVVEWIAGRPRPLPSQPKLPALATVSYADGRLIAVGLSKGRPYAAVSLDQGRSWRTTAVPAPDGAVSRLRLEVDDGDAWLVGSPDDPAVFPWLWRLTEGPDWLAESVIGRPERVDSLVAVGGGLLAVYGPSGSGLIEYGRYAEVGWPLDDDLRVIGDGSLMAVHRGSAELTIWVAPGSGAVRRWIKLVLNQE